MEEQRRHFARIHFHAQVMLTEGGISRGCDLIDLSLKGALLQVSGHDPASQGAHCTLSLVLGDDQETVRMTGTVAHREGKRLGLVWEEIDIDSVTHLRRLLALNRPGDEAGLERELAAMIMNAPDSGPDSDD